MFLQHLHLVNFKNHSELKFEFKQPINFIIGQNGRGKTNILDAIYYLSVFRSHIIHIDNQLIKHNEEFYRLKGEFLESDSENKYEVIGKNNGRSKAIEINQVKITKYSEYFGHIPLVLSTPSDIFLLYDGSEERRKLIDYTISIYNKEYLHKLNQYQHFLDQRNAVLKHEDKFDQNLIDYYNGFLSDLGQYIYLQRKEFIDEFSLKVIYWYEIIAQKNEELSVYYSSKLAENSLADLLIKNLERDKILKRTTSGIHRDDLKLEMKGIDIKKIASQGQQKSLLYALRIAQAEFISKKLNQKIIFLLDDFSDKLDANRKRELLKIIEEIDFVEQWFVTDIQSNEYEKVKRAEAFNLG